MLVTEGESTSYSVILAIPGNDRIFLHNPGANNTFCSGDIPLQALEEAALFHLDVYKRQVLACLLSACGNRGGCAYIGLVYNCQEQ